MQTILSRLSGCRGGIGRFNAHRTDVYPSVHSADGVLPATEQQLLAVAIFMVVL